MESDLRNLIHHIHVWARSHSCPFARIEEVVPKEGNILDFGCGHGAFSKFLKDQSPTRKVVGYDADERKIQYAKKHFETNGLEYHLFHHQNGSLNGNPNCIIATDVFYLIPPEEQKKLLQSFYDLLPKGGQIVIKEMDRRPWYKYHFNVLQEFLMVRLFRLTFGHHFYFLKTDQFLQVLKEMGFEGSFMRIDRGNPYPHVVYVGLKV